MKQKKLLISTLCICTCGTVFAALTPLQSNIKRAQRRANVSIIRDSASQQAARQAIEEQKTNGDEQRYADKRASYGKALVQDASGLINTSAFEQMVKAIETGNIALFNQIPLGTSPIERRLVDPQAGFTFNLDGADNWIHSIPAPPTLVSAQLAGEMVEVYSQAYLRDVYFNDYDTNAQASDVIDYLNALSDFKGPKIGGMVTPQTLFRGSISGDLVGPYISQFLYQPIPYGPADNYSGTVVALDTPSYQQQVTPLPGTSNDFMTDFTSWSDVQKGEYPSATITYDLTERHFLRNERDLADYVLHCYPGQEGINTALILLGYGPNALDTNNPYLNNPTQEGFVTYAIGDIIYLVCLAEQMALRAAWYQKWMVHRRARPEFTGFLINQQKTGVEDFSLSDEIINAEILTDIFDMFGSYFLPIAYPEGSPTHPAYPEGHSTVIGACITMLKAFFNEDFIIPMPVEPDATNMILDPTMYTGPTLTVGNELNKLASNISMGRCAAGVHYRSDAIEGMLLGEKVAIAILENEAFTHHIPFSGFSLTTFAGKKITVGKQLTTQLY